MKVLTKIVETTITTRKRQRIYAVGQRSPKRQKSKAARRINAGRLK
jgi:hypothetical protein